MTIRICQEDSGPFAAPFLSQRHDLCCCEAVLRHVSKLVKELPNDNLQATGERFSNRALRKEPVHDRGGLFGNISGKCSGFGRLQHSMKVHGTIASTEPFTVDVDDRDVQPIYGRWFDRGTTVDCRIPELLQLMSNGVLDPEPDIVISH